MMMNNTLAQLRELKLAGMASAVEEQLSSAGSTALSFEERLALMVDREVHHRGDRRRAALLAQTGKVGVHLRDNEWLMTIKQRTTIPGGVCEFDLPAYHYWLNSDPGARQNDLRAWIAPFLPIYDGLAIVLRLLRDNGRASRQTALGGVFQLMLTTTKVAQLLRLTVPHELPCVPEISANKYALNIRFIGVSGMDRGNAYAHDVDFELAFCNL